MRTADFSPFLFFGTKRWGIAPAFPFFFSFINEWIAGQKKIETIKTFALAEQMKIETIKTFTFAGQKKIETIKTFAFAGQMKIETKMTFAFARHLSFTDLR